jgi:hypothetical protein
MTAVCDVSVLESPENLSTAKRFIGGPYYFPSSTYSWLAREKVISVRDVVLTYSLVSSFVREGEVVVAYLPEILDEVARKLLFEINREVPLSDLRALLLSGHLHLPFLTLDCQALQRLSEKGEILWEFSLQAERIVLREIISAFRNLATEVGEQVFRSLNNGSSGKIAEEFKARRDSSLQSLVSSLGRWRGNSKKLNFKFLFLDLSGPLQDFLKYKTMQRGDLRDVCEKSLCLVISPELLTLRQLENRGQ